MNPSIEIKLYLYKNHKIFYYNGYCFVAWKMSNRRRRHISECVGVDIYHE